MRCCALALLLGLLPGSAAAQAPWFRLDPFAGRDSQGLERVGASAEAGLFLTPVLVLDARTSRTRFAWSDSSARVTTGDIGLHGAVAGPLSFELRFGLAHWSVPAATRLTGRGEAALRIGGGASIHLATERSPYLYTTTAMRTVVLPSGHQLHISLDAPSGWIGEAGMRLDQFDDDNEIRSAWAWLLAPLANGRAGRLRAGWHVGWKDAKHSRYEAVDTGRAADGTRQFTGRYVPYHTPQRTIAHGPAVSLTLWPERAVTLYANGSWGMQAHENAPFYFVADTLPDSPILTGEYRRRFHPIDARATLQWSASRRTSLFLEAAHARNSFYDATRFRSGVLIVFPPTAELAR